MQHFHLMSPNAQVTLVRDTGETVSRGQSETLARAGRLAAALRAHREVRVGDRVALIARNSIEFLEISIAAASAGGVPVPINWHWTAAEIAHVLADANISIIFADPELLERAQLANAQSHAEATIVLTRAPQSGEYYFPAVEDLISLVDKPLDHVEGALAASLGLIYTSGTTGRPKGVQRELMTPHQILSVAGSTAQRMGIRDGGAVLIPGPLYHTSPNAIAVLALRMGAHLVLMDDFDPARFLMLVERYRIEHAKVVPTMLSRLLSLDSDTRAAHDVSSLTHLVHSAAPCPPAIKRASIEWFGEALIEFYGCSEAGTLTWIGADEWLLHPGSVGLPVDGAAIQVVDSAGTPLPPAVEGRVLVRGADYWPKFKYLGEDALQPDFIDVGDKGYLDEEGYLYLTGRSAEVVIIGGTNVYPAEVEAAALSYPPVEDAGALGLPAAAGDLGEEIVLYVVPRPGYELTPAALARHLADRLATIKLPRRIILTENLPRDDNGKLYRHKLMQLDAV